MATSAEQSNESASMLEMLRETSKFELDNLQREIREIELMIEQSQVDVNKLAQRNATVTVQLQQAQAQFESLPRTDIRNAYENALDTQQRLFVMRGQLDKLQSDHGNLTRYHATLERVMGDLESLTLSETPSKATHTATAETVEMMLRAQEAERQRLARAMHDGPAQALSNFILQTEIATRLFDKDQDKAREELTSLKASASTTFQKVRDFIFELRPMMLDDLGLVPTLNRYVQAFQEQTKMDVRFSNTGIDKRLVSYLEVMIFRAIQELLTNISRHSQATQVKVQIDAAAEEVRVMVDDNGVGFEVKSVTDKGGMGLKVIRDRVEMLGGEMDVSSGSGKGTRVSFSVPADFSESMA